MMTPFLSRALVALALAFSPLPSCLGLAGQQTDQARSLADDGPHVIWNGDSADVYWSKGSKCLVKRFGKAPFDLPLPEIAPMTLRLDGKPYAEPELEIPEPPQIFAISDIHGNFKTMRDLLVANKVVDGHNRWTFGKGHLVVLGDVADRGDKVTECYWFIRALEGRAKAAGGRVHMILGNHEVELMTGEHFGSVDPVNPKYRNLPECMPSLTEQYGPDSELGRWLRSRPLMMKIGDTLFVHGGISREFIAEGLDIATANKKLQIAPTAERDGASVFLLGFGGPLWYRGMVLHGSDGDDHDNEYDRYDYFDQKDSVSDTDLGPMLDHLSKNMRTKVKRVVVGHTTGNRVRPLHGGKVLAIDAGIERGHAEGLFMAKGKAYRALADGSKEALQ